MDERITIVINNKKAKKLLLGMEELDLIEIIEGKKNIPAKKVSEKYRNVFSTKDAKSFDDHVKKIRKEWRIS